VLDTHGPRPARGGGPRHEPAAANGGKLWWWRMKKSFGAEVEQFHLWVCLREHQRPKRNFRAVCRPRRAVWHSFILGAPPSSGPGRPPLKFVGSQESLGASEYAAGETERGDRGTRNWIAGEGALGLNFRQGSASYMRRLFAGGLFTQSTQRSSFAICYPL